MDHLCIAVRLKNADITDLGTQRAVLRPIFTDITMVVLKYAVFTLMSERGG